MYILAHLRWCSVNSCSRSVTELWIAVTLQSYSPPQLFALPQTRSLWFDSGAAHFKTAFSCSFCPIFSLPAFPLLRFLLFPHRSTAGWGHVVDIYGPPKLHRSAVIGPTMTLMLRKRSGAGSRKWCSAVAGDGRSSSLMNAGRNVMNRHIRKVSVHQWGFYPTCHCASSLPPQSTTPPCQTQPLSFLYPHHSTPSPSLVWIPFHCNVMGLLVWLMHCDLLGLAVYLFHVHKKK